MKSTLAAVKRQRFPSQASQQVRGLFILIFFKNGPTPASFLFIFCLFKQTSLQFLQRIYVEKMSIQYAVPGFEPTTFGT